MQAFKVDESSRASVVGVCFMPDGRGLVTSTSVGVAVWDVAGTPTAVRRLDPADDDDDSGRVAASPCGRFLAHGGWVLRVFDLSGRRPREVFRTLPGYAFAFAPDGTE